MVDGWPGLQRSSNITAGGGLDGDSVGAGVSLGPGDVKRQWLKVTVSTDAVKGVVVLNGKHFSLG